MCSICGIDIYVKSLVEDIVESINKPGLKMGKSNKSTSIQWEEVALEWV